MIHRLLSIFFFINTLMALAQSVDDFKKDFKNALDKKFSEEELNTLLQTYNAFLTPHSDVTQLSLHLKGQSTTLYPLSDFKTDPLYTNNIKKMIGSENANQRILAYATIAGAGDVSFEASLLDKIKTEKEKTCLIWSGMALLYLNTNRTTPLFDFLVTNESFGDAHMLPLYIQLNKDSLQQTAYARINSGVPMAKILAVQLLSYTGFNPKTERLLKDAVKEWDLNVKGYAIYSIKELQIGNLLELFKPLLNNSQTRGIALEALANSPNRSDREYLSDLLTKQDTISEELLNCFYNSKRTDNVRQWLKLLYTKPLPGEYSFSVYKQPLILKDTLLGDVQTALQKITNAEVLSNLVRALENRTDDRSTDILLTLLTHENASVRYWSAKTLKGNHSPKLISKIPQLLLNGRIREVSLTEVAIENKLDTLQSIYENIYNTELSPDWQRSVLDYLSAFPKIRDKELFRKILKDDDSDEFMKRAAALGLGRLKDKESVDLIIAASKNDAFMTKMNLPKDLKRSNINAKTYLIALGMIKGQKARKELETYKDSKEPEIRELIAGLLKNW